MNASGQEHLKRRILAQRFSDFPPQRRSAGWKILVKWRLPKSVSAKEEWPEEFQRISMPESKDPTKYFTREDATAVSVRGYFGVAKHEEKIRV